MIVVVCMDDKDVLVSAQAQAKKHPGIFGKCYQAFVDKIPPLGVTENLFISAHGTDSGPGGIPVIGNHKDSVYDFSGPVLYANIGPIFPATYSGGIYISACNSADPSLQTNTSFAQAFKKLITGTFPKATVYGVHGECDLDIDPPGHSSWDQV
jgi:hypothetical protein